MKVDNQTSSSELPKKRHGIYKIRARAFMNSKMLKYIWLNGSRSQEGFRIITGVFRFEDRKTFLARRSTFSSPKKNARSIALQKDLNLKSNTVCQISIIRLSNRILGYRWNTFQKY